MGVSSIKKRIKLRGLVVAALLTGWVLALGFGWHSALVYETTPGPAAHTIYTERSEQAPFTCVVVAHPLCPCTRATLRGLRAAIGAHPGQFACRIVFAGPMPADKPENLTLAEAIPGAKIETMTAKAALGKYDAKISGQTFVFDRQGRSVFSGGITASRGHEDPDFAIELFDQIQKGQGRTRAYPVFGCALGD